MKHRIAALALSVVFFAGTLSPGAAADNLRDIKHVLLISIDGMHALDVARYIESHPNSALAELANHGITYSKARTPSN